MCESGGLADLEVAHETDKATLIPGSVFSISYKNFTDAQERVAEEGASQGILFSKTFLAHAEPLLDTLQEHMEYDCA